MAKRRLLALLALALIPVTGCDGDSAEPKPAETPEEVYEQVLESPDSGFKDVEVKRDIEGRVEELEGVTTVSGCKIELEMILGRPMFRLGEVHLEGRQARDLKDKEPDWPNEEVSGGPDNINPTRADVEKLLKSPPKGIKAMVERCRR